MKGRNSRVVSIRLPDGVYTMIKGKATGSVAEYVKEMVIRSVNQPVVIEGTVVFDGRSERPDLVLEDVRPVLDPKQEKLAELRKIMDTVVTPYPTLEAALRAKLAEEALDPNPNVRPPIYDAKIDVAGDLVRKWVNGAWITLVVPELDGEGQPVPEI